MNRLISLTASLAFALIATNAANAGETRVTIENYAFSPAELRVKAGERVVFVNKDESPHNVVDGKGAFRSPALDANESFGKVFDRPGEIVYFCGLHPQMKGRIVVTP